MIPRPSLSLRWLQAAFALTALFWAVLALAGILMGQRSAGGLTSARVAVSSLMLANALLLAFLSRAVGRQTRRIFVFGLLLVAASAVLSVTDEVGAFDILSLAVNILLLLLLFLARAQFLRRASTLASAEDDGA